MADALTFGAVADGSLLSNGRAAGTDNAAAFKEYAEWCRDNNQEFVLPGGGTGFYRTTETLTLYTDADLNATLLVPNNGNVGNGVAIVPKAGSVSSIPVATVRNWTRTTRRSRWIGNLTGYAGHFITVNTGQQALLNRRGGTPMAMGQGFLVTDNQGRLSSNLYGNWTNSTWTAGDFTAKKVESKITVSGAKVLFYYDEAWSGQYPVHQSGANYTARNGNVQGSRIREGNVVWECSSTHTGGSTRDASKWFPVNAGAGVIVTRPNVDLRATDVDNVSGAYLGGGVYLNGVCAVRFFGWSVRNLRVWADNYGFNCDLCHDIELYGGSVFNARRAIDAHKSTSIHTFGGDYPDGVGAHYAWDMSFTNCNLGGSTASNPQVANIAGGNFALYGCDIYVHDQASAAIRGRADLFELADAVRVENCRMVFAAGQQTVTIFECQGPSTGFDFGRDVEMPKLISIVGNDIQVLDPTAAIRPVSMFTAWTAANFPTNILAEGDIHIERNTWNINGGVRPGGTGDPRIRAIYWKPEKYIGQGYRMFVSEVPGFWVQAHSASGPAQDEGCRLSVRVANVPGDVFLRYSNGSHKRYDWDDVGGEVVVLVNSGGANYPALGDEYRGPRFPFARVAGVAETPHPVRFPGLTIATLLAQNATALSGSMYRVTNRQNRIAVADAGTWRWMDGDAAG